VEIDGTHMSLRVNPTFILFYSYPAWLKTDLNIEVENTVGSEPVNGSQPAVAVIIYRDLKRFLASAYSQKLQ
jgi:hypothetical protein